MLKRLRSLLFTVNYPYATLVDRETARNLLRFVSIFGLLLVAVLAMPILFGSVVVNAPILLALLIIPLTFGGITFLIQTGRLQLATHSLLFLISVMAFSGATSTTTGGLTAFLAFLIPLATAGVLTGRRTIILVAIITGALFGFVLFNSPIIVLTINAANRVSTFVFILIIVYFIAALLIYFGDNRLRLLNLFRLEVDELRRSLNAPELADFSLDETNLFKTVLYRLRGDYGFSLAQVALVDGSGISAERLYMALGMNELQRGERFDVSAATPLAEVLRTGEILQVDEESTDVRRRHLAAGMVSALIVPIVHNNKILGAFDLQSSTMTDYTNTQREAFRIYAERVGLALDRTRLLTQLHADVQQQQNIIRGQRQRLEELEQGGRSGLVANTWRDYFEQYSRGTLGFNFDTGNFNLVSAADLTPTLQQALESNTLVETSDENDQHVLSAPIILRNELLGALSFKLPQGATVSDRQREVIQSVVQRLGLALENKRLLQQSQAQASRETKANEVASVLLSSTDVKTVLQLAAQQFTDALGAVNTHIHLQALETGEKR